MGELEFRSEENNDMANEEHIDILQQGVEVWNRWREQHPTIRPDLIRANFSHAYLRNANLSDTDLRRADLSHADLIFVNFVMAKLDGANLSNAHLVGTHLYSASLVLADLSHADLGGANLLQTFLSSTNLSHANLRNVNLSPTYLSDVNLSEATMGQTTFGDLDLREVKGLETVQHDRPSHVSINTVFLSQGHIPEVFLRGTGAPDSFIEYMRSLVSQPIQYYTCFISYSSKDAEFVDRLYTDLQHNNVRCWLDKEDLKIGDKFRNSIDEAIRFHDKLLLVLSKHSVESDWVETEVETAFDKEHKQKKLVLFPVTLDETIMDTEKAWAANIKRTRHIGDFKRWKEHDFYQKTLTRLLRDLKASTQPTT